MLLATGGERELTVAQSQQVSYDDAKQIAWNFWGQHFVRNAKNSL